MNSTIRTAPVLLSAALRPLPLAPLQPVATALLTAVVRAHPSIFNRLGEHAGKRFAIVPTDLPLAFLLEPDQARPAVTVRRDIAPGEADARIAGPFAGLVGLANGTLDGDALFFSRDLSVEGDVEAVVALRNAVDDAGVDLLRDATALLGPFALPLERALRGATRLVENLAADIGARKWS